MTPFAWYLWLAISGWAKRIPSTQPWVTGSAWIFATKQRVFARNLRWLHCTLKWAIYGCGTQQYVVGTNIPQFKEIREMNIFVKTNKTACIYTSVHREDDIINQIIKTYTILNIFCNFSNSSLIVQVLQAWINVIFTHLGFT